MDIKVLSKMKQARVSSTSKIQNACFLFQDEKEMEKAIANAKLISTPEKACDYCEKEVFETQKGLISHLEQVHGAKIKHICFLCKSQFTRRFTLDYHLTVHFDIAKFRCKHTNGNGEVCMKKFET